MIKDTEIKQFRNHERNRGRTFNREGKKYT